ncbi:jhy protein homolog isoform X2 [Halichoeres trimaculatus]
MRGLSVETKQSKMTEQDILSSRAAIPGEEWESAVSDTESLVQERAYQQRLEKNLSHHQQSKSKLVQKNNGCSSLSSDDEDTTDNHVEYLHFFDSLEVAAHLHAKTSPTLPQRTHREKREGRGQYLSVDAYSELRYDPKWKCHLKAAGHFEWTTVPSVMKHNKVQRSKSRQPCAHRQEVVVKGGYSYITDTHPDVVVTSPLTPSHSDQPYHLHPPHSGTGSVISASYIKYSSQPSSQEAHCSGLSCPPPTYVKNKHAVHIQQFKNFNQQGPGGAEGGANKSQATIAQTTPKVISGEKLEEMTKDVVKHNKVTLGRDKPEHNSYMMVHALKKRLNKSPKATQISKENKEESNPPQQRAPVLGVRTEEGDGLIQSCSTQPKNLEWPPTINLNINLSTLPHLPPFQQREQTEPSIMDLTSLQGCPHWIPTSELEVTLSPPYLQKNPAEFSQTSQRSVAAQLQNKNLEMSPETWLRTAAWKWPLSYQRVNRKKSPHEVHCQESSQQLPGIPTTTLSPGSGPHTVLPPIGKPLRGGRVEMVPGQTVDTAEALHSSSGGYLVQMERWRQRGRGTQQALDFTNKKPLKSKKNLQGLSPNYKVMDEARRRLYSNVIQEQNKKISRIPFLMTKDPQSNNKAVPRMKALEYAKAIARRPVQAPPKQRQEHKSESIPERPLCLEGFQPAVLDILRRRHEEEKKLVALFRKVLAV